MTPEPPSEFDRDEVIVCMVIAVCLGNAMISVIYRVLGKSRVSLAMNLKRPWTAEDDRRLLELRATGRSSRSIGVVLKRSSKAVDGRLRILRRRDRDDASADPDVAP